MGFDRQVRTKPKFQALERTFTQQTLAFPTSALAVHTNMGQFLREREEGRKGGLLLTSLSSCCPGMLSWPGMLSCCLLGARGRRDQAVQLLPVPCLNQPLIEFIFYHCLELLPLIPETETSAGKYGKITFIYSTIQTSLQMYQEEPGLIPEPCRDNQKRFLPSECDDNEPQRQNLEELEKSHKIPHPTTTTTLLQGCLLFPLR